LNKRHIGWVLAGATTAQIFSAAGVAVFPVVAPQLAAHLQVDPSWIGYQVSILFAVATAMGPFVATIVLRQGGCRSLQMAMLAGAVSMGVALVGTVPAIAVSSIFGGISLGLVAAGSAHVCTRFAPPTHRNKVFSLKQTGLPLAWALTALVAPAMTLRWGWHSAVAMLIGCNLMTAAALQIVREDWDDDRGATTARVPLTEGFLVLWRDKRLRSLSASSFCFSVVQSCLSSFAVVMLVHDLGFNPVSAGLMLMLVQLAGICGRLFLGWFADATGRSVRALGLSGLIAAACCLVVPFVDAAWPRPLMCVLFAIFGAAIFSWNGVFHAQLARLSPEGKVSIAIGGIMPWIYGGVLAGPALFALTYAQVGHYTTVFGFLAVVAAVGWACTLPARIIDRV
jgi:predicted MFS family arabinose efflux permease